jgi:hypothetical protein
MNIERPVEKKETTQNPFVYNKPVRGSDFYNRDEIIERLLKEMISGKSQGSVWITGERQVGKTSLLNYLHSQYINYNKKIKLYETDEMLNAAFVFLNTQYNRTRDDFYQNMLQCVKTYSDFKIEPLANAFTNFINVIKYLMEVQKYYFFFLVDEFDALVESMATDDQEAATAFLSELNSFIGGTREISFGCILAANHTYDELMKQCGIDKRGSGLVIEPVELPWFTRDQVNELALKYLKDYPLQFTLKETDFCFKMTQGYPYFVQKLFSIMYDYKIKEPDPKAYLLKVKEEYGKTFKETINSWGSAGIPQRTHEKLKGLVSYLVKNAGDRTLSVIFKGIEAYMKSQLKI